MAIGEVTVKSIRDDGELRRTVMEYRDFVEDYLKILRYIYSWVQIYFAIRFTELNMCIKLRYFFSYLNTITELFSF